jgi:hypothetical protein
MPTSRERTWALLSHLSFFVLGIVGPLLIALTKGKHSAFVREQAVEALNFQLTVVLALFVAFVLVLLVIGTVVLLALAAAGVVLSVMAAAASVRGEHYRYPVSLRFVG